MQLDVNPYRILIIEDNLGDKVLIEEYLNARVVAAELLWAESLKEARKRIAEEQFFDVILMDLTLPDSAGESLIRTMLKLAHKTPIIVLTGYDSLSFAKRSMGLGINDYLVKDELDETTLYKSICYSIERKKYILELKNSEQRYSDIFQMSPQPAWCVDTQTQKFLEVNDASITHYGYSRDEFLAMRLNDLCPEMCMDSFAHSTVESHTDRTSFVGVYCHYKKDGQDIIVEIKSRLIHRQGQQVCLMLVNDITAQREYIKNIEYQNQMLQDIIWAQSHQVRAPLARLQGLVQLLQIHDLRGSTTQESATLLAAIQDSSQELDHIIRTVVKKTEDVQIHLRQSTLLS